MLAKLPFDRQALLEAADLIEEHGHCKFLRQVESAYCVLGAISKAAVGDPWALNSNEGPCDLFAAFIGHRYPSLWNNEPERTQEEVVTALRAAALHGL